MFNKIILVGRLGADPELRYLPDGAAVVNMRMATDEIWKNKEGEKVQKTEWHRIVAFRNLADICANYLKKGRLILIEGRVQTRKWTDSQNIDRYTTEVVATNMKMLDTNNKKESSEPEAGGENPGYAYDPGDDIPF